MRLPAIAVVLLAGCGRLAFDAPSDGGGSGSSSDGRASDGALDGSLATTCGTTMAAAMCDGFESGFAPMWNQGTLNGALSLDTSRAYRGTTSLHAHIDAVPGTSNTTNPGARISADLVPSTGTVYLRAWLYLASPADTTNYFLQILNAADLSGQGISGGTRHGQVTANDYTSTLYAESATAMPFDRWTCFELALPSNLQGTTRVYLEGVELADAALLKGTVQPAPDHVEVGLVWVGSVTNQSAIDAWFDEVQIDTQPIGCTR